MPGEVLRLIGSLPPSSALHPVDTIRTPAAKETPCGSAQSAGASSPAKTSLTLAARSTSTLSHASPRGALVGRSLTNHRQVWLSSGLRMCIPTDTVGDRMSSARLELRACPKFAVAGKKFGVPLSITPEVPFPYLRLCKKLEASYSAIRPKRAGNRKF